MARVRRNGMVGLGSVYGSAVPISVNAQSSGCSGMPRRSSRKSLPFCTGGTFRSPKQIRNLRTWEPFESSRRLVRTGQTDVLSPLTTNTPPTISIWSLVARISHGRIPSSLVSSASHSGSSRSRSSSMRASISQRSRPANSRLSDSRSALLASNSHCTHFRRSLTNCSGNSLFVTAMSYAPSVPL
jgi:hypothetical protein